MTWRIHTIPSGERHVVPDDDMRAHDLSAACWCKPSDEGDAILAHRSADGRESFETGARARS
jgi:hypothetical protein